MRATATPAPPAAAATGKDDDFFYFYDDSSKQQGSRKLLIVFMVVLALGLLGVVYLLSRPTAKGPAGANVTITISPTEAQVAAGEAHDFSATVTGSGDTDVNWSVAEGSPGGKVVSRGAQAQGGAVAILGVYVAPTTPGTYHVVATSKADTKKSATAEVLVSGK
jgi:chitinase